MDLIYSVSFYIIAAIIILSALAVVGCKHIMHSLIALVVTFVSMAGIFVLLNADFVAVSQIMIYAVGIVIVMIFAIMLTSEKFNKEEWIAKAPRTLIAPIVAFCLFVLIAFSVIDEFGTKAVTPNMTSPVMASPHVKRLYDYDGTAKRIGEEVFSVYVLPFELLSVLLLAIILGTAVIAKKTDSNLKNPTTKSEIIEG